jgi:hypothetical protein
LERGGWALRERAKVTFPLLRGRVLVLYQKTSLSIGPEQAEEGYDETREMNDVA